jgi:phosphinothricin acetyltransferase
VVVGDGTNVFGFAAALTDCVPAGAPRCEEAIAYVAPAHRRRGAGRAVLAELIAVARMTGAWKVIANALADDVGARSLLTRLDFREIGTLVKHAHLEGVWRDVVLWERLVLAARRTLPSISDA